MSQIRDEPKQVALQWFHTKGERCISIHIVPPKNAPCSSAELMSQPAVAHTASNALPTTLQCTWYVSLAWIPFLNLYICQMDVHPHPNWRPPSPTAPRLRPPALRQRICAHSSHLRRRAAVHTAFCLAARSHQPPCPQRQRLHLRCSAHRRSAVVRAILPQRRHVIFGRTASNVHFKAHTYTTKICSSHSCTPPLRDCVRLWHAWDSFSLPLSLRCLSTTPCTPPCSPMTPSPTTSSPCRPLAGASSNTRSSSTPCSMGSSEKKY